MTKTHCMDCYYKGIKKCLMHHKDYEEVENCTEHLTDWYFYREKESEKQKENTNENNQ